MQQSRVGRLRLALWLHLVTLGRFGVVGVAATLTYFAVTTILGRPPIGINSVAANALGVFASLWVSYFGHHRYTFDVPGQHERYLPRFLIVTAGLFLLSSAAMALGRNVWALDHTLVTALIAVFFPLISFLLNSLWTFAQKRAQIARSSDTTEL